MSQLNPFNGGAVFPGDSVNKNQLKDLTIAHRPDGTPVDIKYSPLDGATVPVSNLSIKVGDGDPVVYDPFGTDKEVTVSNGITVVTADVYGSGTMSATEYAKMISGLDNGELVLVRTGLGASAVTYTFAVRNPSLVGFYTVGSSEVRVLHVMAMETSDGSHECEQFTYPINGSELLPIYTGSSGADVGHEFTKCEQWESSGQRTLPVLVYQNGSSQQYIGNFAGRDGGGYLFIAMDGTGLKGIRVSGNSQLSVFDIAGSQTETSYIRNFDFSVSGWIKTWAASHGMTFGDSLGVVCSNGNNAHYSGSVTALCSSCGCLPCGFIVFLDESGSNALASDESRNVSVQLTISLTGNAAESPEEAKSQVPDVVWLRVFATGGSYHFPLKAPLGYTDGMFVNGDSVHLQDITTKDESTQTYVTERRVSVLLSVVGGSWSFTYVE